MRVYAELAPNRGDASAQFKLARTFYLGKGVPQDYTEAVRWYRKAADQGYAKAEFNLSDLYRDGKGVPQDYAEAVRWCRKAAEQGDTKAQDGLAFMFYQGQGLPQRLHRSCSLRTARPPTRVTRWPRTALDSCITRVKECRRTTPRLSAGTTKPPIRVTRKLNTLSANMYYYGQGVPQDDSEAAAWYRKAAEQGYAQAQPVLGYMYFQGKGVQRKTLRLPGGTGKLPNRGTETRRRALAAMKIGFDTPSKAPVHCPSGKHINADTFQGRHSKSTTAKSSACWSIWPVVGGIGRVRVLPFRRSGGPVGCQCFLLRQELFVRNMRCRVSFCRLAARIQDCANNLRHAVHRIQHLRDDALRSQAPYGMPPRILFREWVVNGNRNHLGIPSLAGG